MEPVRVIKGELVLVDWGPMTLTVSAWLKGRARPVMAAKAGRAALNLLRDLADFKNLMKLDQAELSFARPLPLVVDTAIKAVRQVDPSLTPMAAVAGAVAEMVCKVAVRLGADKVIVNNGGDIGIYLAQGQEALVGLKSPGQDSLVGRLHLNGDSKINGVASSGWQGRSHSPGVADLVCTWAQTAALADAAATFVAGACEVASLAVKKRTADLVDPGSDLGDRSVTVKVGRLNLKEKEEAAQKGLAAAGRLCRAGVIRGCLIDVQGFRAEVDLDNILEVD